MSILGGQVYVKGIAYRSKPKAPMTETKRVEITCDSGVVPDFRGKPGKRQVTLLSLQSWQDACAELGVELPWTLRRANILIDGLRFSAFDVGRIIRIGEAELQVMIETDPCPRMDAQHPGLTAALTPDWRAGVCCKVLKGGTVQVGDAVRYLS
jgi:MOSC domain-containing protein YiiM